MNLFGIKFKIKFEDAKSILECLLARPVAAASASNGKKRLILDACETKQSRTISGQKSGSLTGKNGLFWI